MRKNLIILFCFVLIVASFAFLIHVRVEQTLVGYTVADREESIIDLEERLKQLKLEKEVLMRPERIQEKAHDWFQMRYSHE
jgi:cell division protein FtsL